MKPFYRYIPIILFSILSFLESSASYEVISTTQYIIEKLSTPTIRIGKKNLKKGDRFNAGDEITWTNEHQSMLVKNVNTSETIRFSKRVCEKKGMVKSILDFYLQVNKGSTRGNGNINLVKSDKASDFPEKRIALIIGNQNYQYIAPLKSAQKDAEDISEALSELGFDIIEVYETNYTDLMTGINKFSGLAREYDVALMYYAGHGIQEDGVNYLVPIDNMLDRKADLRDCVSCNEIVDKVEASGCPSKIFYFDACRDRKTTWSRSILNGLSSMEGSVGTVIAFATQSGKVASDGERDGNSPFAEMLIKNMKEPQLSFSEMMSALVRDTYVATEKRQYPVMVGTLISDFRFNPFKAPEPPQFFSITTSDQNNLVTYQSPHRTTVFINAKELDKQGRYVEALQAYLKEKDNPWCQVNIGVLYRDGKGVKQDYKQSFVWFKKSADQGDEVALRNLGLLYANGQGVNKNYDIAFNYLKEAVDKGDFYASYHLGWLFGDTDWEKCNDDIAFSWFEKSADSGNDDALYKIAKAYLEGIYGKDEDIPKAFLILSELSDKNYTEADFDLGEIYFRGKLGQKNYTKAFKYFTKAADKGHDDSQNYLGVMYRNGIGTPINHSKAIDYFRLAALNGNTGYIMNLAEELLHSPEGIRDYKEAFKWFKILADDNNGKAQAYIASMYANGYGVKKDFDEAFKWNKKSAENNNVYGLSALGGMYIDGIATQKNTYLGIKYYTMAAEKGYLQAQYRLGDIYHSGKEVAKDDTIAFSWYLKAADKGHAEASGMIGYLYSKGEGCEINFAKALEYSKKAAEKNIPFAIFNIGWFHYNGKGTPVNKQEAKKWMEKSANLGFEEAKKFLAENQF